MRQILREVFGNPKDALELVGIADTDLLQGTWKLGVVDPRDEINEMRLWFIGEQNDRQDPTDMIENAARLAEKAIAATAIEDLPSNSQTIRYIFGMLEDRLKRLQSSNPPPYFLALYQLLVLSSKPDQRRAILDGVAEAIGLDKAIFG